MPLTALKPSQIRKIAANSLVGNATGAEARGTSLSVSQVRTLLGLGTTDSPTFNTVTATTNVLSPLFNNPNAAATTIGNSTYGVTVPGGAVISGGSVDTGGVRIGGLSALNGGIWDRDVTPSTTNYALGTQSGGSLTFVNGGSHVYVRIANVTQATIQSGSFSMAGSITATGDILMQKATQGYIRAYETAGVKNISMYHDGTFARLTASTGSVLVYGPTAVMIGGNAGAISTQAGGAYVFTDTSASAFGTLLCGPVRSYDVVGGAKYSQLTHDGTYGTLSTSANHIKLAPATGTVELWGVNGVGTGILRVYNQTNTSALSIAGGSSEHIISTTSGSIVFQPVTANTICYTVGTNSTFRVYDSTTAKYTQLTHNSTDGILSTSSGSIVLSAAANVSIQPASGIAACYTAGLNVELRTLNSDASKYSQIVHNGTNGVVSTSSGALIVTPATNTVFSTCATIGYNRGDALLPWSLGLLNTALTEYRNLLNLNNVGTTLSASTGIYGWSSSATPAFNSTNDTGLARDAAGVVEINNGTLVSGGGSYGSLKCAGITASGNVSYAQGLSTGTVTKVAHYTTTADDYRVNVTANSVDITFETAVGCANREHEVVNSGSGVVTLKTTSAQTISGNASGALTLAQWKSIRVVSDGANWIIMSQIT